MGKQGYKVTHSSIANKDVESPSRAMRPQCFRTPGSLTRAYSETFERAWTTVSKAWPPAVLSWAMTNREGIVVVELRELEI